MSKPCQHDPPKTGCRVCWLALHDPRYAALWAGEQVQASAPSTPSTPAARVELPCVYLGDPIQSGEAARLGLDTRRTWRTCGKGHGKTLAGYVCRCKGDACGPACESYEAKQQTEEPDHG